MTIAKEVRSQKAPVGVVVARAEAGVDPLLDPHAAVRVPDADEQVRVAPDPARESQVQDQVNVVRAVVPGRVHAGPALAVVLELREAVLSRPLAGPAVALGTAQAVGLEAVNVPVRARAVQDLVIARVGQAQVQAVVVRPAAEPDRDTVRVGQAQVQAVVVRPVAEPDRDTVPVAQAQDGPRQALVLVVHRVAPAEGEIQGVPVDLEMPLGVKEEITNRGGRLLRGRGRAVKAIEAVAGITGRAALVKDRRRVMRARVIEVVTMAHKRSCRQGRRAFRAT